MRFNNLDKLRAFAALSVVVYHVIEHTNWSTFATNGLSLWWRMGWMGVDLFFVISGFVIYFSAQKLFNHDRENWSSNYISHRLCRIIPLYFSTCLIFIAFIQPEFFTTSIQYIVFQLATHSLFIHNIFPASQGAINGVNWTIGVEMQFYVLVLCSWRWLHQAKPQSVIIIFCSIACLWKFLSFLLLHDSGTHQLWWLTAQLPGSLDEFGFGIAACKWTLSRHHKKKSTLLDSHIIKIIATVLACTMTNYLFWLNSNYWDSVYYVTFFRLLIGISATLLLLTIIGLSNNILGYISSPLDYLGKISYGIYLWHLPVILSLKKISMPTGYTFLILTILITIIISSASFHLLENLWIEKGKSRALQKNIGNLLNKIRTRKPLAS